MMNHIFSPVQIKKTIVWIYVANLLLSFHYFLVIYVNSSYLETFFSKRGISFLFIAGALLSILFFIEAPKILRRFGNWHFILAAIAIEFLAVLGMAFANDKFTVGWFFIIHQALVPMILFSLDVFLEEMTKDESHTGELRGVYLTLTSIALVISPIIVGFVLSGANFERIYILSALLCLPLFAIAFKDLLIPDRKALHVNIRDTIEDVRKNKDVKNVTFSYLTLQIFYAWMIIYMPLYLINVIGFTWSELGLLFSIMLLPFVLFEIPVGWLADKLFGEKEFMITGLIIIALSMFIVPFITGKTFILWAIILFISRIGASFLEVTTESHFFKRVGAQSVNVISFFRTMRPLSFVLAPVIFTLALNVFDFRTSFFVLSAFVLLGINSAGNITDTK